ncbi:MULTISPECIES: hypothetical protein [Mycolicibacterium]|uniref:Prokaryotic metallothionein n=1 Tax=Mycolicibacterium senegalense TaxID=1796 RepID=A0A378W375_9MYCO|nr:MULTISPECIES: hypothetical protein [Mycolicibacterium]MCV7336783.1 hypothetical protein [Mycolicibacterium senegalense]MDR7291672.1 DNA-directed RNA polymerase subunit RPC12/RpoP [Mycolicibacterium senegalense]QZA23130.1 hypothetical protein K3U95_20815 [Mycolicibacterium senegalense]CDP84554.1 hypothetical protein BN975_01625 [Mycolicibacterium farcinogenes]SUA27279.1 Uncharacterised protein [Mycolicibacterium senegalense]
MATCATCGNDYDKAFTVSWDGHAETFDSIECAAVRVAPECAHCGCRILGHGVQAAQTMYCCAHCARESGHSELVDRQRAG